MKDALQASQRYASTYTKSIFLLAKDYAILSIKSHILSKVTIPARE